MPLHEADRESRYKPAEAARILLQEVPTTTKCQKHPLRVRKNASFLVDTRSYTNWEDMKDDMNGVFNKVLRCAVWTVECTKDAEEGQMQFSVLEKKALRLTASNQYHLHINSRANKACPQLVRSFFHLKDASSNFVNDSVLMQYHITTGQESVTFEVKPHGNSRNARSAPFYPTSKSTLESIKKKSHTDTPSRVHKAVNDEMGGPSKARTPGCLPRSKKQVLDMKSHAKRKSDPVDDLLVYARKRERNIVLRHQDMPTDLWVLGTDVMCRDVSKFTTCEQLNFPISIDPTFNMGQFEVTPIVYRHLLLTSKRTGNSPIFLGPTMIHHRKDFETYKVLSSTCVAVCKDMREKCKGYITDGEAALDMAFKSDLQKATHLRCAKHFEGNCKSELTKIGIRGKSQQKMFLGEIFGVKEKHDGLIDCEDKQAVKQKASELKDFFDKKETELLQKQSHYEPQFSKYIMNSRKMIAKNMSLKQRREAGLPNDAHGKPIRPYTNSSEAMNHVMSQIKLEFLSANGRRQNDNLSKLEFTRHVFEEIHNTEQEEFKLAVCGLSEKYQLSDVASYLQVPVDTWFSWNDRQRDHYISKLNDMSMEDVLQEKRVRVTSTSEDTAQREYRELSIDVAKALKEMTTCPEETIQAAVNGAVRLLNLPCAIQQKASLQSHQTNVTYEVASRDAKNSNWQCMVLKDHVKCRCPSYKYDSVCMHSIAVAERANILDTHVKFLSKSNHRAQSRTALAEAHVNKGTAGKKGSRNKTPYRPQPTGVTNNSCNASGQVYTQLHHNDNPFILRILPKEAKSCKQCRNDFCHRIRVVPHDLVFEHKEKYFFPLNGDWKNKQVSSHEASRYYHADANCMKKRFPYFCNQYIEVPADVKDKLSKSHKDHLYSQFQLKL